MVRLSILFSLSFLISCSSIRFHSTNSIPVSFETKEFQNKEVSVEVSKPFYMWGLVPAEQVVEVDKIFNEKGFESVSDLSIKEINTKTKAVWMFITLGMYYPQTYKLTANRN